MAIEFKNPKEYLGELIGTMLLIGFGCFAGGSLGGGVSSLYTATAFALGFVCLVYCLGGICNCHFNPLISLSMFVNGKMDASDTLFHVLAQLIGGIIGAIFAFFMLTQELYTDSVLIYPSLFGRNITIAEYVSFDRIDWIGAFIAEFAFALILCFVAMKATESKKIDMKSGAIIAVAMFGLIYFGAGLTNTAVNPAKSIGTAIAMLFSGIKDFYLPIVQIWLFIFAPLLGAAVACFLYMAFESKTFDVNKFVDDMKEKQAERAAQKAAAAEAKAAAEAEAAAAAAETAEESSEENLTTEGLAEELAAEEPVAEAPVSEEAPKEEVVSDPVPEIEPIEEEPSEEKKE